MPRSKSAWWIGVAGGVLLGLLSGCPKRQPPAPLGTGPKGVPAQPGPPGIGEREIPPGERVRERVEGKGEESPLQDIYFAFDSYELSLEAREILQANAQWLQNHPQARVEVEGHCDERGTNQYNLALGAKRAKAARDYLVALGIAQDRISTISYGEELPVCREPHEACWQQNRRAHFLVLTQ